MGAPTSCRPSRFTSFPSLTGTAGTDRARLVRSPRSGAHRPRAWGFYAGPPTGSSNGDDKISQVPGEPLAACPALRPRRDLHARPLLRFGAAFRSEYGIGSRNKHSFGALSHGPHPRCLRFAGRVAPPPRKTRFRLLGQLRRAGFHTRRVPSQGFTSFILLAQALLGANAVLLVAYA